MITPQIPNDTSRPTKIMLVGEMLGKQELLLKRPFVGSTGKELTNLLSEAGIDREDCYITTVFWEQPERGKIENFCAKKAEVGGKSYPYKPLRSGKYFKPEHINNVHPHDLVDVELAYPNASPVTEIVDVFTRLQRQIEIVQPNIVVALGNAACWALLGEAGITKLRGTLVESPNMPGVKILPTFPPAQIMRQWESRPIMLCDLMKAKHESEFPEIRQLRREIWIEPDLADIMNWKNILLQAEYLSIDIETAAQQIKSISFSPNPTVAFVIPLMDARKLDGSYWTQENEVVVWEMIRHLCATRIPKVFQNGLYDLQYLARAGCRVNSCVHDTMLCHHSLQPELPKGLGFLGSIYCNERAWKDLRPKGDELKANE